MSLTAKDLALLEGMGEPMSAATVDRFIRAFFYGDPGAGKTDLIAKIMRELNLKNIWLTTDSGWTTITKYPDVAENVWRIPFDSFAHIRLLVQAHDEGIEPFCNYNAITLDTASTAIDMMLRDLVKAKPLPKEQQDPSLEAWGHYRMLEASLKDTVEVLNNSNMHVFYTAHIRDPKDKDKEKKRFAIRPAGPEASYRVIAQEVNLIGWLFKEARGGQRMIQTEGTLQETGKSQIPTIPETTIPVDQLPELMTKFVNQ